MKSKNEMLPEIEREIIRYIELGYANWEIARKLQEKEETKWVKAFKIGKIRRVYMSTLSKEQKGEIETQVTKRWWKNHRETEIKKLKEGYTVEELVQLYNPICCDKKAVTNDVEKRLKKYIEFGIITPEEMQLARENRQLKQSVNTLNSRENSGR